MLLKQAFILVVVGHTENLYKKDMSWKEIINSLIKNWNLIKPNELN